MTPTRSRVLLAVVLGTALVTFAIVGMVYREIPPLPQYAWVSLLLLGVAELVTAQAVRTRLAGRPGTKPILPIAVARAAALAKASSLVAALAVGVYGALCAYALGQRARIEVAGSDALVSALGVVAALVLGGAALLLERVCRVPDPPPPSAQSDAGPYA